MGIWVEQITTADALLAASDSPAAVAAPTVATPMDQSHEALMRRYRGLPAAPQTAPTPDQTALAGGVGQTNNLLTLVCRAVSLTSVDSSANPSIAYAVESEIKNSPMVDPACHAAFGEHFAG